MSKSRKGQAIWFIRRNGLDLEFGTRTPRRSRLIISWIAEKRRFSEYVSVRSFGREITRGQATNATVEVLLPYVPGYAMAALLAASIEAANAPQEDNLIAAVLNAGAVTAPKLAPKNFNKFK